MNWFYRKIAMIEKVISAAVLIGGKIYTGPSHGAASVQAYEDIYDLEMSSSGSQVWKDFSNWIRNQNKQNLDGFITNTGRFIDRTTANEIAEQAEQFKATRQQVRGPSQLDSADVNY